MKDLLGQGRLSSDGSNDGSKTIEDSKAATPEPPEFEHLHRFIRSQDWAGVVRSVQGILLQEPDPKPELAQISRRKRSGAILADSQYQVALDALLLALEWGDFQVRWDVAKVLPTLGEGAIAPLLEWLQDDEGDADIQWFVVRMLGSWTGEVGVERLMEVLKSGTPELQSMALSVLVQQGSGILDRLKPLLVTPDSRMLAVQVLAGIRSRDTLDLLLTVVHDENPVIRTVALEALSSFQDARLGPLFIAAIGDSVTQVRSTSAIAIGFCQTLPVIDRVRHLTPLLWDVQISVCCTAASSLGRLAHEESIAALQKSLLSKPLPTTLGVELVRSLFHISNTEGYADAIAGLTSYLTHALDLPTRDESSLAIISEILRVLGRVNTTGAKSIALQTLLHCLRQPNLHQSDRLLVISALGPLKDPRSIDPLIQQLIHPDPTLRLHVLHALQQINAPLAQQRLQSQQSQPHTSIPLQDGINFAIAEWR